MEKSYLGEKNNFIPKNFKINNTQVFNKFILVDEKLYKKICQDNGNKYSMLYNFEFIEENKIKIYLLDNIFIYEISDKMLAFGIFDNFSLNSHILAFGIQFLIVTNENSDSNKEIKELFKCKDLDVYLTNKRGIDFFESQNSRKIEMINNKKEKVGYFINISNYSPENYYNRKANKYESYPVNNNKKDNYNGSASIKMNKNNPEKALLSNHNNKIRKDNNSYYNNRYYDNENNDEIEQDSDIIEDIIIQDNNNLGMPEEIYDCEDNIFSLGIDIKKNKKFSNNISMDKIPKKEKKEINIQMKKSKFGPLDYNKNPNLNSQKEFKSNNYKLKFDKKIVNANPLESQNNTNLNNKNILNLDINQKFQNNPYLNNKNILDKKKCQNSEFNLTSSNFNNIPKEKENNITNIYNSTIKIENFNNNTDNKHNSNKINSDHNNNFNNINIINSKNYNSNLYENNSKSISHSSSNDNFNKNISKSGEGIFKIANQNLKSNEFQKYEEKIEEEYNDFEYNCFDNDFKEEKNISNENNEVRVNNFINEKDIPKKRSKTSDKHQKLYLINNKDKDAQKNIFPLLNQKENKKKKMNINIAQPNTYKIKKSMSKANKKNYLQFVSQPNLRDMEDYKKTQMNRNKKFVAENEEKINKNIIKLRAIYEHREEVYQRHLKNDEIFRITMKQKVMFKQEMMRLRLKKMAESNNKWNNELNLLKK